MTEYVITHITDVDGVLLGQDHGWQIDHAGELLAAWGLAVEPLIEDLHGVLSFDDVH